MISSINKAHHPEAYRNYREMESVAILFKGKHKVTDLTLLTVNLTLALACCWTKTVRECMLAHTKQQRDTMGAENTKSIFIGGPKMKASSGGCQSRTEAATTQLSVLRKGVTRRRRRLREWERQREERILSREACGKIKPGDSEHSLTDALEKHSQHWWTEAFYAVLRGQR